MSAAAKESLSATKESLSAAKESLYQIHCETRLLQSGGTWITKYGDVTSESEFDSWTMSRPVRLTPCTMCIVCKKKDFDEEQVITHTLPGCVYEYPANLLMTYYTCDAAKCGLLATRSLAYHLAYSVRMLPVNFYVTEFKQLETMRFNRTSRSTTLTTGDWSVTHIGWSQSKQCGAVQLYNEKNDVQATATADEFFTANPVTSPVWTKACLLSPVKYPLAFPTKVSEKINMWIAQWNKMASSCMPATSVAFVITCNKPGETKPATSGS